jgi:phosphatidylserine decarboxylase
MNPAMGLLDTMLSVLSPPHRAGRPFIAGGLAVAVLGLFVSHALLAAGLAAALFCWFFFRDPERVASPIPGALLAPADGRITAIDLIPPPPELGLGAEPRWRVATFLSVLNVHVNRMPAAGLVTRVAYHEGKFLNAAADKASEENERNALALSLADGRSIAVVQIAGLIARRILCDAREGDRVTAGARFGIIRFGSRTDLYLPPGITPVVAVGQTAIGGETVMAILEKPSLSNGVSQSEDGGFGGTGTVPPTFLRFLA